MDSELPSLSRSFIPSLKLLVDLILLSLISKLSCTQHRNNTNSVYSFDKSLDVRNLEGSCFNSCNTENSTIGQVGIVRCKVLPSILHTQVISQCNKKIKIAKDYNICSNILTCMIVFAKFKSLTLLLLFINFSSMLDNISDIIILSEVGL